MHRCVKSTNLVTAVSAGARRVVWSVVLLGCTVGFLRTAFPTRAHLLRALSNSVISADSVAETSDDSGDLTLGQAPLPRNSFRRAVLVLGEGLPVVMVASLAYPDRDGLPELRTLVPESVDPSPPFHPPRVAHRDERPPLIAA